MAEIGQTVDNPSAANFLRRVFHRSAVVGDFLYIDGGEITQLVNGALNPEQTHGSGPAHQNNVTLSIDLRKSWTNSTVDIKAIAKPLVPILNFGGLWICPDEKSFYIWSGELGYEAFNYPWLSNSLWKFTSDGTGLGIWSQEPINYTDVSPLPSTGQTLLRPGGKGNCNEVINGVGYQFGGHIWKDSDAVASPMGYYKNTITSFNTSSGVWRNDLITRIGSSGTIDGAQSRIVSALGLDGRDLIVIIGGFDPGTNASAPTKNYFDFGNITFYDPYIDRWYAQSAIGDIPGVREYFCAVSVAGDDGTFEIFIYGGLKFGGQNIVDVVYQDVYVLSIPGFVWFKASHASAPARWGHTCNNLKGNQLISIGGIDNPETDWNIWGEVALPDPYPQGIGIFDMTEMKWQSSYIADAPAYQSPKPVRDWYSAGKQESVQWQSLEIARMFVRDASVSVNPTPAATASANPTTTNLASSNTNRSNRTEVIGVAAGLGSFIVAVMVLGFSLWKWYHPRRSSNNGRPHDNLFEDSSDSYQLDASSAEAGTVTSDSQLTTATRPVVSESLATENSLMRR